MTSSHKKLYNLRLERAAESSGSYAFLADPLSLNLLHRASMLAFLPLNVEVDVTKEALRTRAFDGFRCGHIRRDTPGATAAFSVFRWQPNTCEQSSHTRKATPCSRPSERIRTSVPVHLR